MAGETELNGPRRAAASGQARQLVVLLHGYGANGDDLFGLAEPLAGVLPDAAFVSPNAPERCAGAPFGFQWFPIPWIDGSSQETMQTSFARSAGVLDAFLTSELARHGVAESAAALIGFSQGAMMSLHVGPRREAALAGIVGFSGRLIAGERLAAEARSKPPVLLVHGDLDEVLPVGDMVAAAEGLRDAGFQVDTHVSRGVGHGIAPDGLRLAAGFLSNTLRRAEP